MPVHYDDVVAWIKAFASAIEENKGYLTELDSAIGDADHGTNMHRGFQAAVQKLEESPGDDIGAALKGVGMTLVSKIGGAGGPLYGTLFMQMGTALAGKSELEADDWATALEAGVKGVQTRGKAELEEATMLDALLPAVQALKDAIGAASSMEAALVEATEAAEKGMESTVPMVARKGRASYLGERSVGHQDPGATSSYLLMRAASDVLVTKEAS
ncbi:MAG: dihydroxyacetone kinase subunit DhaL [Actinomycetota bacterium]|nr:dihydroxyacetone kinase subunit DhaL [Actinomycetota bacterium]